MNGLPPVSDAQTLLRIRVWGMDAANRPFNQSAHVTEFTSAGIRIGGLKSQLAQGEILGISHENKKGRFRIVWVGKREGQIAVLPLDSSNDVWSWYDSKGRTAAGPARGERRNMPRYPCQGAAKIGQSGSEVPLHATVIDIGLSGFYAEMTYPLSAFSPVTVVLNVDNISIGAEGVARSSHPGVGMGIQFTKLLEADQKALTELIESLRKKQS